MTQGATNGWNWGLWARQIGAVMRLELKKSFLSRRSLWVYPLLFAPAFLTFMHSAFMWYRGSSSHGIGFDTRAYAALFQFGYLRTGIYFGCVVLFMNLFRGEVLGHTLHYYFLVPIRRDVLAAGKFLSALTAAVVLFGGSVAASYVAMILHFGPQAQDFLFGGEGLTQLGAYVGVTVLACIGYGSVFLLMGILMRNPIIPAFIIMVWEGINTFLPPALKKVSIIFYLKSLSPVAVPETGLGALLGVSADPTPAYLAVPGMLLLAAVILVYAGYRARHMEIHYVE